MMEAEMDDHLGYEKSERSGSDDHRNGYKEKTVNSNYGSVRIEVPQDRKSTYEPKVVKKRQKDISEIDQKIISMYAKGMTTRQISDTLMDIYPVLFIDAIHYSVRDNGIIRKLAAYVILGISCGRSACRQAGRRVIYTTNAIEKISAAYRKLNRRRSVFPSSQALLKALYPAAFEAAKNGLRRSGTGVRHTAN